MEVPQYSEMSLRVFKKIECPDRGDYSELITFNSISKFKESWFNPSKYYDKNGEYGRKLKNFLMNLDNVSNDYLDCILKDELLNRFVQNGEETFVLDEKRKKSSERIVVHYFEIRASILPLLKEKEGMVAGELEKTVRERVTHYIRGKRKKKYAYATYRDVQVKRPVLYGELYNYLNEKFPKVKGNVKNFEQYLNEKSKYLMNLDLDEWLKEVKGDQDLKTKKRW